LFIYLFYYYYHNRHLIYIQTPHEERLKYPRLSKKTGTGTYSDSSSASSTRRRKESSPYIVFREPRDFILDYLRPVSVSVVPTRPCIGRANKLEEIPCGIVESFSRLIDSIATDTVSSRVHVISLVYGQWPLEEQFAMSVYAELVKLLQSDQKVIALFVFSGRDDLVCSQGSSLHQALVGSGVFSVILELSFQKDAVIAMSKSICDVLPGIMAENERHRLKVDPADTLVIKIYTHTYIYIYV